MYYDLKLTLLGQLGFLGPVTTVCMVQIYVPEHLRSLPSKIDENQLLVGSKPIRFQTFETDSRLAVVIIVWIE